MRKMHIAGLAIFAVLAFSAVAATSAFAETTVQWLAGGNVITAALPVSTSGTLHLTTLVLGIKGAELTCPGILDGTVGPGKADTITELLTTGGVLINKTALTGTGLDCTVAVSAGKVCGNVGELAEVWAINLPWTTELELMSAAPEFLDLITTATAGWYALCPGGKTNTCEGATSSKVENETGGVLGEFNPAAPISSAKGTCTEGGAGAGDVEGSGLTTLNSGEALTVSEA